MKNLRANVRLANQVNRRGAMIPLVGVMMVLLLIFVALMIDTSWMALSKTEQQMAVDEASRCALTYLATNKSKATGEEREAEAIAFAQNLFKLDTIGGKLQSNVNVGIELGQVEEVAGVRNFLPNARPINGVRGTSDSNNGTLEPIKLFFANLFGVSDFKPKSTAVLACRPIDIVICVDASGSMSRVIDGTTLPPGAVSDHPAPGSRWFDLLVALNVFLEGMQERNSLVRIGLVTFGGAGPVGTPKDLTLPPAVTEVSLVDSTGWSQTQTVLQGYGVLGLQGSTDISAGIRASTALLMSDTSNGMNRFIIVMSDGEQYTPYYAADIPEIAAAEAAALNISVHTLLIGPSSAGPQLVRVALAGNGQFYGQSLSQSDLVATFQTLMSRFAFSLVE